MNSNKTVERLLMDMILDGMPFRKMTVRSFVSCDVNEGKLTNNIYALHNKDTNAALHYYSYENARTSNGVLNITTERKVNTYKAFDEIKKVFYADKKYIQSGMLQSWNKFCFIGGVVEFSAKLPGDPHKGGLWPACKSFVD